MIEKILKPVRFDKEIPWLVVAHDGEKFFVAKEDMLIEDPNMDLVEMGSRSLLQWAMEFQYPLRKFVRLQKLLVEKYFSP
jgi:hypothetical protein